MSYFSSRHGVPGVPAIFYWRMGWDGMDGWSGNLFFWPISRKLLVFFFKLVRILLENVSRYFFPKNSKKLKKITFFKNCRQNRGLVFFPLFQTLICKFLENNMIFFLSTFGPLRRLFKTSSAKKSKKITIFKFFNKFRTCQFLAIFRQFSILMGIPYTKI